MFEIGNSLREARLRRGIDFPQAEVATKIRGKYLRALEDEQFEVLPAQTYIKGFLRTYAEYLGLDGQLYVDEYNSRFVSGADEHEPRARRSAARPQQRNRRIETNVVLVALAAIAVLTVIVISAWKASDSGTTPPAAKKTSTVSTVDDDARACRRCSRSIPLQGATHLIVHKGSATGKLLFDGTLSAGAGAHAFHGSRLWLQIDTPGEPEVRRARQGRARAGHAAAGHLRHEDRLAPRVAIVASGSELVRGDRHDRNGPYLAADLLRRGVDPARITVVGDDPADLEAALREGLEYDLLVISGGLGPTHDDRTIELLARAAGVGLFTDEELAAAIEQLSRRVAERLQRPYTDFADGVRKQATLPVGAEWVGLVGTAPAVVLPTWRAGRRRAAWAASRAAGALAAGVRDRAAQADPRARAGARPARLADVRCLRVGRRPVARRCRRRR